ncbi:unnamed protein product [Brassicogethes aeneus]|uniref:peptidylprolyl isomerase n=1 Tax=Brassicogethes aeneus TaxID=1431903 RepID=A0A9P0FHA9_BRAAE|nr:unnamed protein product [Brassicogethes aeneus]
MFWGLIMEPQRRYTQQVKKAFHISMASLDVAASSEEVSQVMCGYEGKNYLLCTLKKPNVLQCPLDLNFEVGSEVSFAANGKCHIHLTGYLTDDLQNLDDEQAEEEEEIDGDEAEEDDDVVVEEEQESNPGKKRKQKNTEIPSGKKSKVGKVSSSQDDDLDSEIEVEEEEEDEDSESDTDELEEDSSAEEEEEEEPKVASKMNGDAKKKEKEALKQKQQQPQKEKDSNKKRVLQGGVVVEEIREGQGKPAKSGRYVTVYYEGRLKSNNKMFDSNTKGAGFSFRLGSGEVIKGWDVGVAGMKPGSKRRIVCPPNMAYGARGSPPTIPPNSTLVFEVELKKIS